MKISAKKLRLIQGLVVLIMLVVAVILYVQNMHNAFLITLIVGNAVSLLFAAAIHERTE